ncbi:MAG: chemotaxis protein CheW [Rhodospirillales bacterium]|nr:chemotaxis protein CheW [Rhodospirillales bacterium]
MSTNSESHGSRDFVTFTIADQLFGIRVLQVQDVLASHRINPIPLVPDEIAGSLNLRGRIVTVINMRRRLGLAPRDEGEVDMSIVVEHGQELYSLVVDSVGEVLPLSAEAYESNPPTLEAHLRAYSAGIYRLEDQLLVVLDVDKLLDYGRTAAA